MHAYIDKEAATNGVGLKTLRYLQKIKRTPAQTQTLTQAKAIASGKRVDSMTDGIEKQIKVIRRVQEIGGKPTGPMMRRAKISIVDAKNQNKATRSYINLSDKQKG